MNDEYLWDRGGKPDPELEHLESALGGLRWSQPALSPASCAARPRRARFNSRAWMAAAAALLVCACGLAVFLQKRNPALGQVTSWQLSLPGEKASALRAGQVVETPPRGNATIRSSFVGEVQIEANSRLRLLHARSQEDRLSLDHGTIHALIWAPPAQFVVDTPAAQTVDLGCQYTLHVDRAGAGYLTVQMGWVAFEWQRIESFIPAGAACRTRPGRGPGTPYFVDAPAGLVEAVNAFDQKADPVALESVLAAARARDALTLWHLMERTQGQQRREVFARFARLVSLPPSVTSSSILNGERAAMDSAWDALQLGDTTWWRTWKRRW
jgi:hypothetical protein